MLKKKLSVPRNDEQKKKRGGGRKLFVKRKKKNKDSISQQAKIWLVKKMTLP